ncbi:hypothetical protein [Micropruina sp.]
MSLQRFEVHIELGGTTVPVGSAEVEDPAGGRMQRNSACPKLTSDA